MLQGAVSSPASSADEKMTEAVRIEPEDMSEMWNWKRHSKRICCCGIIPVSYIVDDEVFRRW